MYSALLDSLHTRTQPYTTTYQPYCTHRDLTRRSLLIRNFPYYFRLYYGLITVFPLHPFSGLFRCCLFVGFILSMVCLLAGIASARTSAFVEGEGVEPPLRSQGPVTVAHSRYTNLPCMSAAFLASLTSSSPSDA